MEELFKTFAGYVALGVETAAALLIVIGAAEALYNMLARFFTGQVSPGIRKETWGRFGVWLLLGLEFELAADIVRTRFHPPGMRLGSLGRSPAFAPSSTTSLKKTSKDMADRHHPKKKLLRPPSALLEGR